MTVFKLKDVDDSVCEGCSQNWDGECRAYLMPHSDEERKSRSAAKRNCSIEAYEETENVKKEI